MLKLAYSRLVRQIASKMGYLLHQHVLVPQRFQPFRVQILEDPRKLAQTSIIMSLVHKFPENVIYENCEKSRHSGSP